MPLSARKFLLFFFPDFFSMLLLILSPFYCSGDEDEDPPFDATARTSTSRTLVVSEAQPDGDETSPPQQDIEHPTPIASPRAPSPKRARVELAKEPTLPIDSSTTPSMDDVSSLLLLSSEFFNDVDSPLFLLLFCLLLSNFSIPILIFLSLLFFCSL